MGLTIIAGGCRYTTDSGKTAVTRCDQCPSRGGCELEPRARELGAMVAEQWVSTADLPPPEETLVLYVEQGSKPPTDTVRLGYYDGGKGLYQEAASGAILSEKAVAAWMLIPPTPWSISKRPRRTRRPLHRLTAADVLD